MDPQLAEQAEIDGARSALRDRLVGLPPGAQMRCALVSARLAWRLLLDLEPWSASVTSEDLRLAAASLAEIEAGVRAPGSRWQARIESRLQVPAAGGVDPPAEPVRTNALRALGYAWSATDHRWPLVDTRAAALHTQLGWCRLYAYSTIDFVESWWIACQAALPIADVYDAELL